MLSSGSPQRWFVWYALLACACPPITAFSQDYEQEPIRYSQSQPESRVSRFLADVQAGAKTLEYEEGCGYLRSLLAALDVPVSSQTLVFSKTSRQRDRISPRTPRALYFSDDVYVGFCQNGEVLEVSAVDPHFGAVFCTLSQQVTATPVVRRQTILAVLRDTLPELPDYWREPNGA